MCRLLGLLSAHGESAEPWLVRSDRSLLAQAHASAETAQRDGWGIGWFSPEGRPRVVKGVRGAFEPGERERFTATARAADSALVLGHLRHASNPMNLPADQLLGPENSQPFDTHAVLFAHNGMIPFPRETRPYLGVHEKEVRGVNDSEVLFRLLLRHVEEVGDPLLAYGHAVEDLVRVRKESGLAHVEPFTGLNILFAPSPDELWAFCLWTGDHGPGLLDTSRPYYEMAYRLTPHSLVVGSEPFDREPGAWTSLRRGTYVYARRGPGKIDFRTGRVPLPESFGLTPPTG